MVKFAQHIEWAPPNHPHCGSNSNGNSNVKKLHKTLGELFNLPSNPMVLSNPNPTEATTKRNANKKADLVYSKSGPLFSNPPYQHYVNHNRSTWSSAQVRHHGLSEEEKEMEFMCYCCDDLPASAPQSGEMGPQQIATRKKSVGFLEQQQQSIAKNPSRKSKEVGQILTSPSRKSGELGKNAKNPPWKSSDSEQNARSPPLKSSSNGIFWHGGKDLPSAKSRGLASESEKTKKLQWPNMEGLIRLRKKDQKQNEKQKQKQQKQKQKKKKKKEVGGGGAKFHGMFGKGMFSLHRNASRKIDDNGEDEEEDEEDEEEEEEDEEDEEDEDEDEEEDEEEDEDDDDDDDDDGDGGSDGHQKKLGNPRKRESKKAMVMSVEIPERMLGLAWMGSTPLLLPAGVHEFGAGSGTATDGGFMLQEVVSENTSFVKHGNLHRVRIRDGHLGVAWVDGAASLLEPGVSVHTCRPPAPPTSNHKFSYITTDDAMLSEKEFVLGPFRVVNVDDTEVGIKFRNRLPHILYSGRHCLSISRLEVFAGFESLLKRQSNVCGVSAMSKDDRKVTVDVWLEWQIGPDDAAAARVANVTDVDAGISEKVRRAFSLVMWEVSADDIHPDGDASVMTRLSGDVRQELMDLFEEGWTITLWELQVKRLTISPQESREPERK